MSVAAVLALVAMVLPLAAAALAVPLVPTAAARLLGLGTASSVVAAAAAAWLFDLGAGDAPLALDAGAALPVAVTATLALVGLVACPRLSLDRATVCTTLATLGALAGLLCARTPVAVVALLPASLLPCWVALRRRGSSAELRAACGLVVAGTCVPLVIAGLLVVGGRDATPQLVALLVLAALAVRLGVVPLHSWLPVLLEHAPLPTSLLVASAPVVPWVVARAVLPAAPDALVVAGPLLLVLGTLGALYGAILGIVQEHLRRTLGWILMSQSGAVLAALAVASPESVSGALLGSLALGLTSAGLVVLTWAVESRTGTASMARLGGLIAKTPRLGLGFLALGFAQIGFPGSLGFVAEDVMLHGILGHHPIVGALLLVATALNAVTIFRAYKRAFLGPLPRDGRLRGVLDLVPRERAVALALAIMIAVTGLLPGPFLGLAHRVAHASLAPDEVASVASPASALAVRTPAR